MDAAEESTGAGGFGIAAPSADGVATTAGVAFIAFAPLGTLLSPTAAAFSPNEDPLVRNCCPAGVGSGTLFPVAKEMEDAGCWSEFGGFSNFVRNEATDGRMVENLRVGAFILGFVLLVVVVGGSCADEDSF